MDHKTKAQFVIYTDVFGFVIYADIFIIVFIIYIRMCSIHISNLHRDIVGFEDK